MESNMKNLALLAWMVGAAGCGKVGNAGTDASMFDAAPDADLVGHARVVTQSHVAGDGAVAASMSGVQVFALRPNSSMVDLQTTDNAGGAALTIYPGGSVTAIYPHVYDNNATAAQQGADLVTFMGVKDADALTFGTRFTPYKGGTAANQVGTVNVTVSGAGATTGFVEVETPCGYTEPPQFTAQTATVAIPVYAWCNVSPFEIGGYIYQDAPTAGATSYTYNAPTLNNGNASFALSFPAGHAFTMSTTGVPAEVTSVSFNTQPTLSPEIFSDGNFANGGGTNVGGVVSGGAYTGMGTIYPIGDHLLGALHFSRAGGFSSTTLYDQLPTNATAWTVTAPTLVPWLNGSALFSSEHRLEWSSEATTGASAIDAVVVTLTWSHAMMIGNTNVALPYSWTIILPPDATSVTWPTLPTQFAADQPQPETDTIDSNVRLVEFPSINGYDALRALPERNIVCPDCAVRVGEIPRAIFTN
jgi:hypothetical protein